MAKYFFIVFLVVLCSSFNLCEKKVKIDGKVSRVYIYPDCDDTSTYLKQRFQANHVVEYLYINSRLQYKRILDKTESWIVNEYSYDAYGKHEVHINDTFKANIPDKIFTINDSCSLNIEYYNDGGYHICTYGYNRKRECQHPDVYASTIVFERAYIGKMMGHLQVICDTNSVTDAFTNEELVKIVHRERQSGLWHTYNANDYIIDSTTYDPMREK